MVSQRLLGCVDMDKVFFKLVIVNYNNMAYIKRCIESIINQTFKDYKVIIIDDISTDNSDKLANIFAQKFSDKVIFKQLDNKGFAGAARNFGINYPILSEYTWFIDSDDYLASNNVLERMHKKLIESKYPDILRCSYIDGDISNKRFVKLNSIVNNILVDGAAPFKTCIRSKFNQQFVENRARNNDVVWFMRLMDAIDYSKISSTSFPCYVYNRQSITSCQNNKHMLINKKCVDADRMLVDDLKAISFNKQNVCDRKQRILQRYENKYKPIITINEAMQHSLVISINKERYMSMCKLFKQYGINQAPSILYGSTFKDKSGPYNCKHSHMRAVQYAKKHNWPFIMIFEDDAYPCDDVVSLLDQYLYAIPKDAQLVLLGWSHSYSQRFNLPFNRITETAISGSHAYILFKEAYDRFIEYHQKFPNRSADNTVFYEISPSYIISKPLFIQYTKSKSMNGHVGFAYYGNHKEPPNGFSLNLIT